MKIPVKKVAASGKKFAIRCKPDYSPVEKTYRKNQIIVTYDHFPTAADEEKVRSYFHDMGFDNIAVKKCSNCNMPVQLWQAAHIETVIVAKGVTAGSGPGTKTVGESYSLNFLNTIPHQDFEAPVTFPSSAKSSLSPADEIRIAVLDTGIDTALVEGQYIAGSLPNAEGFGCFNQTAAGWNFIEENANYQDDSPGRHGSLVAQFIINEFKRYPGKRLQLIPVKTHDESGRGDLFTILCAIYYAIAKGANIINASWGFYFYEKQPLPQLQAVMQMLKKRGILFITAAGNQDAKDDKVATGVFLANTGVAPTPKQLRNLALHPFLPACMSRKGNNVLTVTTTDGERVAATANFSNRFVDMGVRSLIDRNGDLWFRVPFAQDGDPGLVRGSSFATAIATGVIGARCSNALFTPGKVSKTLFINDLAQRNLQGRGNPVCEHLEALDTSLIREGVCVNSDAGTLA